MKDTKPFWEHEEKKDQWKEGFWRRLCLALICLFLGAWATDFHHRNKEKGVEYFNPNWRINLQKTQD